MPKARPLRVLVALAFLVSAACGGGGGVDSEGTTSAVGAPDESSSPASDVSTVDIENFKFVPATFTVASGTKVAVVNKDDAAHTLTADDGSFDTGSIEGGDTVDLEITGSGAVPYHCTIHDYMKGTVTVGDA